MTVTSKDSGKSFHAPSEEAAKRDERLREEFKHMKDAAGAEDGSADQDDDDDDDDREDQRGKNQGEPGMPEQFAAAFRRRGYREKYQREETPVREDPVKKIGQVQANYRSAFSAARCGDCAHFQSGSGTCELVEGKISADSVCDLYEPKREDATEAASRLYAENQVERYSNAAGELPSETADVSPAKAKQILRDGTANGQPLTEAQRGMFGAIAGRQE